MNGNIIDSGGAKSEFVNFNPSTLTYNMMLKAGAPAIGAGTATGAPTVDILGAPAPRPIRRAPTDIRGEEISPERITHSQ